MSAVDLHIHRTPMNTRLIQERAWNISATMLAAYTEEEILAMLTPDFERVVEAKIVEQDVGPFGFPSLFGGAAKLAIVRGVLREKEGEDE